MPFVLIKGHFMPKVGNPDGDSVRFKANNRSLWKKLEGAPARVGTKGATKDTVQLRFEGIDAIEKSATKPLSADARESMFRLIGHNDQAPEPEGYILARMTDDKSGRPIAFAFAGTTATPDGKADVYLRAPLLRQSVNYRQMKLGFAYPLYYNTLFADLRREFDKALSAAKAARLGYWPKDATARGVQVRGKDDLAKMPPIWPKLWRRLQEWYSPAKRNTSLAGFDDFLAKKDERVDLLDIMEERGLQDIVKVRGNKIALTTAPENIRVVGEAGRRKR